MPRFVCPKCETRSKYESDGTGRATCPSCGERVKLPRRKAAPERAAEAPDEDEKDLRADLPDAFFPAASQLGRPRYRIDPQPLPNDAYKPVFAAALCCIPCAIGVFAGPLLMQILALLCIGGFVGFAVWFIRYQTRKSKIYAVVWTDGFVLYDGLEFVCWRWADIACLTMQNIDQRTLVLLIETSRLQTKFYRLRHRNGTAYQFWSTQGPRAAQFGMEVEQETYRVMMPEAVTRLEGGQSVKFGPLEMRPDGLVYREQFTPWTDIGPAGFENGSLRLDGMGPQKGKVLVLLQKIDNHHVFMPLLEQKVGFAGDD